MPENRQSIAGSLFQTLTRLCTTIGYGVATAIFNSVKSNPASSGYYANNLIEPYAATFWFSAAAAALSVLFVPWLKIGTQGHAGDKGRLNESRKSLEAEAIQDPSSPLGTSAIEKEMARPKDIESGL